MSRSNIYFILDKNKNPYSCCRDEYEKWISNFDNKIVGRYICDLFIISTIFLGFDYNFQDIKIDPEPILFETMIIDKKNNQWLDDYCYRYKTYKEALKGHEQSIKWATGKFNGY